MREMQSLSKQVWAALVALALVLPAPQVMAASQETGSSNTDGNRSNTDNKRDRCRLVTAKKGETAVLVPREKFTQSEGKKFPYLGSQAGLRPEFQVEDDRARECAGYFGLPYAGSTGPTAVASAAGVGAAPAGVGVGGLAVGAISVPAALGIGLGVAAVVGVAAAVAGKSNSSSGTR